jgi:hypothetical protein
MTIHAVDKNFKLVEVPVTYRDRPEGSVSKLNTYSDGLKVLRTIAILFKEYKPAMFFNIWAIMLFIIGVLIGLPAYIGYFETGLVEKFPSLIVSCFGILMALLFWVTGIILEVIAKKQKQNYELYLNLLKQKNEK